MLLRVLCLVVLFSNAQAQEWPAKPVRIIVPVSARGSADLPPRILRGEAAHGWGQPVVVENRPGAAGNIGADAVYKAEPDGYTLLSAPPPPLVINRLLYPKLSYDSTQFVPMSVIAAIPNVLLVHPKLGVNTVQDFVLLIKQNPGKFNYASQGNGTTSHLTAELFKSMAGGLEITHVAYKGTSPALADLLGGRVEMMCENRGGPRAQGRAGRWKALAAGSRKRVPALPDVPALAESLPGFESLAWFGIVGPPKTPASIADKVSSGVIAALKLPEVQKRLADLSADPMGLRPGETAP